MDVRRAGSGNIGAANVARTAGLPLGLVALLIDSAKGALPVLVARAATATPALQTGVGFAAFAGHVFPVTLRFAGGKGVATALGVLLALHPLGAGITAAIFALVLWRSGYVSLASMLAALAAPAVIGCLGGPVGTIAIATAMAAVIVVRHRDNLDRLRAGTEPQLRLHK